MEIEQFIQSHIEELQQLLIELCQIPAPLHQEMERAKFCRDWLIQQGADTTVIDETGNVLFPYQLHNPAGIIVLMAHMDTVFAKETELKVHKQNGNMYCPGIGDDTANLAIMLMLAKYVVMNQVRLPYGILFVADCGEEGLGNLFGSRAVIQKYEKKIAYMIAFDLHYHEIINRSVGSLRYEVSVKTPGGHSYHDFGQDNAIMVLSEIIHQLYQYPVAQTASKTTYNIGTIEGGTGVNCIAESACMTVDLRSDSLMELNSLKKYLNDIVESVSGKTVKVRLTEIGNRPCMQMNAENLKMQALLTAKYKRLIEMLTSQKVKLVSGSTDCNIPLSLGIPAISFGLCDGGGVHTTKEWIQTDSLYIGLQIAINSINIMREYL